MRLKLKKYNTGGDIGSAVGGIAGNFIPIPGVGPVIGSFAGKFLGENLENLFTKKKRNRQNREMADIEKNTNMVQGSLGNRMFAKGGYLKPMGDALKVQGRSHEKGGVKIPELGIELEGGETIDDVNGSPFVFSKQLKLGNKSFAKHHEDGMKKGAGEAFIHDLAKVQESQKGEDTVGSRFRNDYKFNLGGFLTNIGNYVKDNPDQVAQYVGPAFNVLSGLTRANKAPTISAPTLDNSSLGNLGNMKTTYNINPQLAEQRRAFSTLANTGAGNNQLLAAHSQSIQNRANLLGEKENRETALFNRQQELLSGAKRQLSLANSRSQLQADLFNAQAKQGARSANQALVGTGLSQIGEIISARRQDQRMQEAEESKMAAALAGANPETIDYFIKNKDRLKEILGSLK